MKRLLIFVCVILAPSAGGTRINTLLDDMTSVMADPKLRGVIRPDYDKLYNIFKQEYSEDEDTSDNFHPSDNIFRENIDNILQHNLKYAKNQTSYKKKVNRLSDIPIDEIRRKFEVFTGTDEERLGNYTYVEASKKGKLRGDLYIDWRDKGFVTPVKNQNPCGSCYAFATIASAETQLWAKTGKQTLLSEQELVDCSITIGGCKGAYVGNSINYLITNGIMSSTDYPYEKKLGECRRDENLTVTKAKSMLRLTSGDENALLDALKIGPVIISIHLTDDFYSYAEGIFTDDNCQLKTSHAMALVGFGNEGGREYYVLKNSWGTYYGEDGYMRIDKKTAEECGMLIEAFVPIM